MGKNVQIIHLGLSNVYSVQKAVEYLGYSCTLVQNGEDLLETSPVILPGVGAFGDGMQALIKANFPEALKRALKAGSPILGICLGMQLFLKKSYEFGEHEGLGLFNGEVRLLPSQENMKRPHMGWEFFVKLKPEFEFLKDQSAYFVHSYYCECDESIIAARAFFGSFEFPAIIKKENLTGFQFHGEKSARTGLLLLKKFLKSD